MKKTLYVFMILSFIGSCTKNEDLLDKKYRMTEIIESSDNVSFRRFFTYENNKIKRINLSRNENNQGWNEKGKIEFSYTTNGITQTYFSINDFDNLILSKKEELTFENSVLVSKEEYEYFNGELKRIRSRSFQYNADGILHIDILLNGTLNNKTDFIYNENQLKVINYYNPEGDWIEDYNAFYKYTGNQLNEFETQFKVNIGDEWEHRANVKSVYNKGTLSELVIREWNTDTQEWVYDYSSYFDYDSNNNLEIIHNTIGDEFVFKFEEGETNIDKLLTTHTTLFKGWPLQMKYIMSEF